MVLMIMSSAAADANFPTSIMRRQGTNENSVGDLTSLHSPRAHHFLARRYEYTPDSNRDNHAALICSSSLATNSFRHVDDFIRLLLRHHFDELRPIIERMLRSADRTVAQSGARLAGLAALYHESAADLDREAATGSAPQRLGLAEVAAANVAVEECRAWCEERLNAFFNDEDEDVRKEAASCFRQLRDESLERYAPLILTFTDGVSYRDDSMSILHLLENSLRRLPGITCVVCEKFLERFSDEARDVRTSRMGDAHTVTQFVFRTYHQHQQDGWTGRALDLIDRLCLEGIGDARQELDAFER